MSEPLVSIMLPSRGKPGMLMRCVESIYSSASQPLLSNMWDLIVWLDDDDTESLNLKPRLMLMGVRVFVGPKLGYDLLDRGYYTLCAYHSHAPWVWILNDDMVLSGDWLTKLLEANRENTFCQPEIHGLGTSNYHKDNRTGCPIFLNGCWTKFGWHTVPAKADYILTDRLEKEGWQCHFLEGVKVWHDHV